MLVSRDEQSCLIVSYREVRLLALVLLGKVLVRLVKLTPCPLTQIKNCVESAFADLSRS